MPHFVAHVELLFDAASLEAAGREIRRLQEAAAAAGFDLRSAEVVPALPQVAEDNGWTSYGPIKPPEEPGATD
jgi:hypothetical protein